MNEDVSRQFRTAVPVQKQEARTIGETGSFTGGGSATAKLRASNSLLFAISMWPHETTSVLQRVGPDHAVEAAHQLPSDPCREGRLAAAG